MRRAIITLFLFGAALFGTSSMLSAHPGHGGGPGHTHGPSLLHNHSLGHSHGGVILYNSNFVYPRRFFIQQPMIIHGGHLHSHRMFHGGGLLHDFHDHGGMRIRTHRIRLGIGF